MIKIPSQAKKTMSQNYDKDKIKPSVSILNSFDSSSPKPNNHKKIYENRFQSDEKRLSSIFENKINKSLIGTALELSRNLSTQDRDDMWELLKLDRLESPRHTDDLLCTDMIDSIEQALISSPILTRSAVFNQITNLRLMDCGIEEMDDSLTGLNNLKLLNLSGNWIKYITGTQLPRNLGILEMFSNELSSVRSLSENLPETLVHIGLGRNHISNDSGIELLAGNKITMLRSLDFSDNDVVDLLRVLDSLSGIPHLLTLQLQGNPCSMCYLYREAVSAKLAKLKFLDCFPLDKSDELIDQDLLQDGAYGGALFFYCYRLMGVPQPDKNDINEKQKVIPKYYVEIEATLLKEPEAEKNEDDEKTSAESQNIEPKPNSPVQPLLEKPETEENKDGDKPSVTSQNLESRQNSFKTPSVGWKPVISFPEPCIRIKQTGLDGLKNLRDTFRSYIKVRIVYVRSVPPEKPKKNEPVPTTPLEDIILSETTWAEFEVPLETITWSHASLDYTWEKISEENTEIAKLLSACAKYLNYKEPGAKKPTKNRSPGSISLPIPEILTCHIGFGLQKTLPDSEKDQIVVIEENPKKKGK